MNWLVRFTARALEAEEREAVLGDIAESEATGWRATCDVLGLAFRRQLEIWTGWRPWFALIAVAGLSGFCLSMMFWGLDLTIAEQIRTWQKYGVHYNTGVTSFADQMTQLVVLAMAIVCWSASIGSVLPRLSGRATWLTGLFLYLVVLDSAVGRFVLSGNIQHRDGAPWWSYLHWILPLNGPFILLFAVPAMVAMRKRLSGLIPITVICTIAAAALGEIRAHDLERFSGGEFSAPSWLAVLTPYLIVSWPVALGLRSGSVATRPASR